MRLRDVLLLALLFPLPARSATPMQNAPDFLSAIEAKPALDWVGTQNSRTFHILEGDRRYDGFHAEALGIAQSHDRIPTPRMIGGAVYNLWQDAQHRRGIWRRADLASYRTASPRWHTVIDLDALSAAEHANWVWKGVTCVEPSERRCLVLLSDAGEDATTAREFDIPSGTFVAGGFVLPHSKQDIAWEDQDTLLVARDWGRGSLTASGYPFIVKRLHRGQPAGQAVEVARGVPADVFDRPEVLVDGDGHRAALIRRAVSFFVNRYDLLTPQGLVPLALPPKATVVALVANRLVAKLDQPWQPPRDRRSPPAAWWRSTSRIRTQPLSWCSRPTRASRSRRTRSPARAATSWRRSTTTCAARPGCSAPPPAAGARGACPCRTTCRSAWSTPDRRTTTCSCR